MNRSRSPLGSAFLTVVVLALLVLLAPATSSGDGEEAPPPVPAQAAPAVDGPDPKSAAEGTVESSRLDREVVRGLPFTVLDVLTLLGVVVAVGFMALALRRLTRVPHRR